MSLWLLEPRLNLSQSCYCVSDLHKEPSYLSLAPTLTPKRKSLSLTITEMLAEKFFGPRKSCLR